MEVLLKQKIDLGARILLGLIYVVFGLNFFFQFIPIPPPPEKMATIMGGFMATGYLLLVVKIIEISCGALLLAGKFIPLAMILLAPITINIFLIHAFAAPEGLPIALVLVVLSALIAWARFDHFKPVLKMNTPLS